MLYGRATISRCTISLGYMAVRLYGRFENSPESTLIFGYMAAKRPIFSEIPWVSHMDETFAEIHQKYTFGVGKKFRKIVENPQNFRFYGRFEKLGKSIREARFLSIIWPFGYMAEKSRFWTICGFRSIIWPAI